MTHLFCSKPEGPFLPAVLREHCIRCQSICPYWTAPGAYICNLMTRQLQGRDEEGQRWLDIVHFKQACIQAKGSSYLDPAGHSDKILEANQIMPCFCPREKSLFPFPFVTAMHSGICTGPRGTHATECSCIPRPWQHPLVPWKSDFSFVLYLHIQDNVSACIFPNSLQAELCGEMSHPVSPQPCVS